ncbi:MAG: hypothetical protein LQ341_006547, partial [Variospora aurantia]
AKLESFSVNTSHDEQASLVSGAEIFADLILSSILIALSGHGASGGFIGRFADAKMDSLREPSN